MKKKRCKTPAGKPPVGGWQTPQENMIARFEAMHEGSHWWFVDDDPITHAHLQQALFNAQQNK